LCFADGGQSTAAEVTAPTQTTAPIIEEGSMTISVKLYSSVVEQVKLVFVDQSSATRTMTLTSGFAPVPDGNPNDAFGHHTSTKTISYDFSTDPVVSVADCTEADFFGLPYGE
jgi:hypothetical protein